MSFIASLSLTSRLIMSFILSWSWWFSTSLRLRLRLIRFCLQFEFSFSSICVRTHSTYSSLCLMQIYFIILTADFQLRVNRPSFKINQWFSNRALASDAWYETGRNNNTFHSLMRTHCPTGVDGLKPRRCQVSILWCLVSTSRHWTVVSLPLKVCPPT